MATDSAETPPPARKFLRTVTPPYRDRRDTEMSAIGWAIALTMIVLFIPLALPLLVVWVVLRLLR